jgi:hypothetical protein
MPTTPIDPQQVPGWGIDADPRNDPTYPMKLRNNGEHAGYTWERPAQQRPRVEVLKSNERPNLSATFGTSTPPRGLSGAIRRFAYKYSESSYGHWLPLMLADRIGVVEGIIQDLVHGHVPNLSAERGARADWRYNRAAAIRRSAITGVVATGLVVGIAYWFSQRRSRTA